MSWSAFAQEAKIGLEEKHRVALASGTRLGPYEIVSLLGSGGMGEVYKARDNRLGRTVAVKVLLAAQGEDPDRRARLEREAKAIAALNHPNICAIHDVGQQDGVEFLVLEYLEGTTLADRLARGPLTLEELHRFGIQMADALACAHRLGIVHRDLKPGNVMLTPSGVKLLDFGLARLSPRPGLADTVTQDVSITQAGALVGTIPYMAPEQLAGQEADARTDIFSLGAILYEAATGQRAFPGANAAEIMAAVFSRDPSPLPSLRAEVSPLLDQAVRRCLARDPDQRWQSAADLNHVLALAAAEQTGGSEGRRAEPARRSALLALGLLVLGALGGALATSARRAPLPPRSTVRFAIAPPAGEAVVTAENATLALSPDGRRLAYVGTRGGTQGLYVRSLDSQESAWLEGTEGARSPFFSPDGQSLGFQAGHKLMRVAITGGAPRVLATVPYFSGASWGASGDIIYVPTFTRGLWKLSSDGGRPVRLTEPGSGHVHVWPDVLPGGNAVLFTAGAGTNFDQASIEVLELETGLRRTLATGGFYARFLAPDKVVFARGGKLLSVTFDPKTLRVGEHVTPVLDGVRSDVNEACAAFAVSQNGALAYVRGAPGAPQRSLIWVDRDGRGRSLSQRTRTFYSVRIAPDGRRVAVSLADSAQLSIWMHDPARDALSRVSFGADDHSPAWSPDGRRIAFESGREGPHGLFIRPSDGSGEDQRVTLATDDRYLDDWSPDGRLLAFTEFHPETGADLWLVNPGALDTARPFLKTPFFEDEAAFSPDGRLLAYVSDESGRDEIYVRTLSGEGKLAVSDGIGHEPVWSRSGSELFFRRAARLMAVPVRTNPVFSAGKPKQLFEGSYHLNNFPSRTYDVAFDGRFLMLRDDEETARAPRIEVVLSLDEELRRAGRD